MLDVGHDDIERLPQIVSDDRGPLFAQPLQLLQHGDVLVADNDTFQLTVPTMYRGDAEEHRNLATIRRPHEHLLSLELLSPQHSASWPFFPWQRFSIGSADLSSIVIERGNAGLAHDLERTAVCDDLFSSCLDKMDAVGGILHDGAKPCSLQVELIPQLTLVNSRSRMRG